MIKTLLIAALISIAATGTVTAQAGTPDSSYGTNGVKSYPGALKALGAPGGETYVAYGFYDYDAEVHTVQVARYLPDGSLDVTYGTNGYSARLAIEKMGGLALQPDGKLIVSGSTDANRTPGGHDDEYTARLTTSGALDTTFNGVGYTTFTFGELSYESPKSVMAGANIITVNGISTTPAFGETDFYMNAYDSNGHNFVQVYIDVPANFDDPPDLSNYHINTAIQGNKLIVSTSAFDHYDDETGDEIIKNTLTRYNADRSVDISFQPTAFLTALGNTYTGPLVATADGKIIISSGNVLYGLNNDGSIDNSFGDNGVQTINLDLQTIIAQGDKIITGSSNGGNFVLSRFNSDGSPDFTFGSGGTTVTNFDNSNGTLKLTTAAGRLFVNGNDFVAAYKLKITAGVACPPDNLVYADKGICSAVVNGIDPAGEADNVTYTLTGATTGSGSGTASGKTFNKGQTLVTYSTSDPASTCSFTITVKDSAVNIVGFLADQSVCRGSTVEESVTTTGLVSSYQWYKDGVSLGAAQQTAILTLTNVSSANTGQYKVVVTGSCSSDTSNTFTIKVNSALKVSIPDAYTIDYYYSKCRTNTVYKGYINYATYAVLLSKVSGGRPPYTYSWSTGAKISYVTVNPPATTTYTLTVTDASGCTATATRQIKVLDVRCGTNSNQVQVCHQNTSTLCLNSAEVAEHLSHGDCLGNCVEGSSEQRMVYNENEKSLQTNDANQIILKASPNPSNTYFSVEVKSNNQKDKVFIKVTDIAGRIVEVREENAGKTIHIGAAYPPGIYLLQSLQNNKTTTLKLIKQ